MTQPSPFPERSSGQPDSFRFVSGRTAFTARRECGCLVSGTWLEPDDPVLLEVLAEWLTGGLVVRLEDRPVLKAERCDAHRTHAGQRRAEISRVEGD